MSEKSKKKPEILTEGYQPRVREGGYQPPKNPDIKPPTQPPNVGSAIRKPPDKPRQ